MDHLEGGGTLFILPTGSWREQMPTFHESCGLLRTHMLPTAYRRLASVWEALKVGQIVEKR